jgi:hypothetical protein
MTVLLTGLFVYTNAVAQDSTVTKTEIDPSKPTNLYTQVNTTLECQDQKTQNLFGCRINVQYALNPDNLFLLELPFLYNDRTSKFGVSDTRIRYFNVVKRNISKSFIAIAPFADVTVPTGSYTSGLSSSSWNLSGGVLFGFLLSKKLSLFPGISYVHVTKPGTGMIPEQNKFSSNGFSLQCNTVYMFNKTTFIAVNPTPSFLDSNGNWNTNWTTDLNFNKIIKPNKFKMNLGCTPNFTTSAITVRFGSTFFL